MEHVGKVTEYTVFASTASSASPAYKVYAHTATGGISAATNQAAVNMQRTGLGSLVGVVRSSQTGAPIPNAKISVIGNYTASAPYEQVLGNITSDANGNFTYNGLVVPEIYRFVMTGKATPQYIDVWGQSPITQDLIY